MDLEARTDDVHRQVLQFLPPDLFDFADLEVGVARLMAMFAGAPAQLPDSVVVDDRRITTPDGHELLVRLYRPAQPGANLPALYWVHGGGMVLGDVAMEDAQNAAVCEKLGIVVASVEYRLAPAHPYPTPLDDCYLGLAWLFDNATDLGLDPQRIAIGGVSGGGGLAAGLALLARDRGQLHPCFQLLRYPMIDDRNVTPSSHAVTDQRVWNRTANVASWAAYLGGRNGSANVPSYAAPARETNLAGLPPAIVTVGELDLFLDENIDYAQGLLRAGVATELHVYVGAFHASDVMVPHAPVSGRWRRDEFSALARAFGLDEPAS